MLWGLGFVIMDEAAHALCPCVAMACRHLQAPSVQSALPYPVGHTPRNGCQHQAQMHAWSSTVLALTTTGPTSSCTHSRVRRKRPPPAAHAVAHEPMPSVDAAERIPPRCAFACFRAVPMHSGLSARNACRTLLFHSRQMEVRGCSPRVSLRTTLGTSAKLALGGGPARTLPMTCKCGTLPRAGLVCTRSTAHPPSHAYSC